MQLVLGSGNGSGNSGVDDSIVLCDFLNGLGVGSGELALGSGKGALLCSDRVREGGVHTVDLGGEHTQQSVNGGDVVVVLRQGVGNPRFHRLLTGSDSLPDGLDVGCLHLALGGAYSGGVGRSELAHRSANLGGVVACERRAERVDSCRNVGSNLIVYSGLECLDGGVEALDACLDARHHGLQAVILRQGGKACLGPCLGGKALAHLLGERGELTIDIALEAGNLFLERGVLGLEGGDLLFDGLEVGLDGALESGQLIEQRLRGSGVLTLKFLFEGLHLVIGGSQFLFESLGGGL